MPTPGSRSTAEGFVTDADLRALVGDAPFTHDRSHEDREVVRRKQAALSAPHVAAFDGWRAATLETMGRAGVRSAADHLPHVDPVSGGAGARVVVLHAGPFPCLMGVNGGSGIVSPDNTDGIATRMWRLAREAGLPRSEVVEWNATPWPAGLGLGRAAARPVLDGWLAVLRRPERVVLLGATAREFRRQVERTLPGVDVRVAPSPGQMARITTPDFEEQIARALGGR
ncbi:hypothetical protein [Aquipuribacter sp. MA13-6]|uniref:hypothetical protein n=1 Tax=unclassified Aquipuribacter TaxID=2635084 RepID=UPI003EEEAD6D